MKEVITLQFGEQANCVGAHYWNLMRAAVSDEAAAAGLHSPDTLATDTLFCTDGRQTYTPRVLVFDQPSNHPLPDDGSVDTVDTDEADAQWNGHHVEVHRQQRRPSALPSDPDTRRSWTDILSPTLPSWAFTPVSGVEFGSSLGQLPTFAEGRQVFRGMDARDELLEGSFRRYAEACDRVQGFQVLADAYGGFSGFGAAYVECVREEYPKSPVALYNASCDKTVGQLDAAGRVDVAVALAAALEADVSMSVPLYAPSLLQGAMQGGAFLAANVAQWGWGLVSRGMELGDVVDRATRQRGFRVAETLLAPGLDASQFADLAGLLGNGGFTACSDARVESCDMLAGRLFADRGTNAGRIVRQTMAPEASVDLGASMPLPPSFPPISSPPIVPKQIGGVACVGVAGLLCSTSGSMGYLQMLHGSLAVEHSRLLKLYEREAVREFRHSLDEAIDRATMPSGDSANIMSGSSVNMNGALDTIGLADSDGRVINAHLGRCRQWLHPRRSLQRASPAGCPSIYDTRTTALSECLSTSETTTPSSSHAATSPTVTTAASEAMTQSLGNTRSLAGSSSSRSRRRAVAWGLRRQSRALRAEAALWPSASCSTASLASSPTTARSPAHANGSSRFPPADGHVADNAADDALGPVAMVQPPAEVPVAGRWACTCVLCAGARDVLPMQPLAQPAAPPPRDSSLAFMDADYVVAESEYAVYAESLADEDDGHVDEPLQADAGATAPATAAAAAANAPGVPNAAVIANIFATGQTPQHRAEVSRARRLSQRLASLGARAVGLATLGRSSASSSSVGRDSRRALLDALASEATLLSSIRTLSKTRATNQSLAFRMRADRVHMAQGQMLHCIHTLFIQVVPMAARRSRHYRFYLPEDDQVELDRGFSESVLFAAQALARGYQIRGTEMHTQALREPAWLLCSVWAAVRHVLSLRGRRLWLAWTAREQAAAEEGALRSVLEDFDDAWVRFERDLCFAYFGLGSGQVAQQHWAGVAGDPAESDGGGGGAQEDEFAVLVVLLSETLQRCLATGLVSHEQMETMDPLLILALPRLAILQAIARGGLDGLCFAEPGAHEQQQQQQQQPVFWWFREYTAQCRRISDALGMWPEGLLDIMQHVVIAEEADVALQGAEPRIAELLRADEPPEQTLVEHAPPVRRPVDLDSIIDSPRSARSLSFDCIASGEPLGGAARAHAKSLSEATDMDDGLAARISAACADLAGAPALLTPQASVQGELPSLAGSLTPTSVESRLSWPRPIAGGAVVAAKSRVAKRNAERKARVAECLKAAKQIYVDLCTVSDSLHSGPFARPFRVALELVFRMNATDDDANPPAPQ
ncbi:hypothetical protein GGI15_002491 [Coemansia interrupta]|uniref:Uncharacterized protein n=1 Tax=Coemansia interrupta TaxID=1126814 RepID=A0A9W8HEN3_9FUNG|nr:hypothetical protein GGI15_002491 [Coemansia interrupta]